MFVELTSTSRTNWPVLLVLVLNVLLQCLVLRPFSGGSGRFINVGRRRGQSIGGWWVGRMGSCGYKTIFKIADLLNEYHHLKRGNYTNALYFLSHMLTHWLRGMMVSGWVLNTHWITKYKFMEILFKPFSVQHGDYCPMQCYMKTDWCIGTRPPCDLYIRSDQENNITRTSNTKSIKHLYHIYYVWTY